MCSFPKCCASGSTGRSGKVPKHSRRSCLPFSLTLPPTASPVAGKVTHQARLVAVFAQALQSPAPCAVRDPEAPPGAKAKVSSTDSWVVACPAAIQALQDMAAEAHDLLAVVAAHTRQSAPHIPLPARPLMVSWRHWPMRLLGNRAACAAAPVVLAQELLASL